MRAVCDFVSVSFIVVLVAGAAGQTPAGKPLERWEYGELRYMERSTHPVDGVPSMESLGWVRTASSASTAGHAWAQS